MIERYPENLKPIAEEASEIYDTYKWVFNGYYTEAKDRIEGEQKAFEKRYAAPEHAEETARRREETTTSLKELYDTQIQPILDESQEFADQHESELYDIAVIDGYHG